MVTAFVLVHAHSKDFTRMAQEMLAIDGVSEVHVVAGEYDLVVVLRATDTTALSRLLTEQLVHVQGVDRTKTLISLSAFPEVDLDALFGQR